MTLLLHRLQTVPAVAPATTISRNAQTRVARKTCKISLGLAHRLALVCGQKAKELGEKNGKLVHVYLFFALAFRQKVAQRHHGHRPRLHAA
jgi:hypothetical protein